MLTVNLQEIKKGIVGDKYNQFLTEFPEIKTELESFHTKPGCGSCERNIIPKLYADPNYDEKIKRIYGQDVVIDKTMAPQMPPPIPENKVFKIPRNEWESWFAEINRNPIHQIRYMTTFIEDGYVICSVSMLSRNMTNSGMMTMKPGPNALINR